MQTRKEHRRVPAPTLLITPTEAHLVLPPDGLRFDRGSESERFFAAECGDSWVFCSGRIRSLGWAGPVSSPTSAPGLGVGSDPVCPLPCTSSPAFARPWARVWFSCPMHLSRGCLGRCLVIISAGFSVPRTLRSSSCFVPWISWIQRQLMLMCLNLLAPLRFATANAAEESA